MIMNVCTVSVPVLNLGNTIVLYTVNSRQYKSPGKFPSIVLANLQNRYNSLGNKKQACSIGNKGRLSQLCTLMGLPEVSVRSILRDFCNQQMDMGNN